MLQSHPVDAVGHSVNSFEWIRVIEESRQGWDGDAIGDNKRLKHSLDSVDSLLAKCSVTGTIGEEYQISKDGYDGLCDAQCAVNAGAQSNAARVLSF